MIDIHSHLLPGVDDGAEDMAMSIEMAQMYLENGYTKVIVTPHWIEYAGTTSKSTNEDVLKKLKQVFEKENIFLELYLGNEFFITPNLLQYVSNGDGASMNDSRYVLVEFSMTEYAPFIESTLYSLQLKGYIPIIAHPERYEYYGQKPNDLAKLINKGVLTQMNLPSLTGQYGKEIQKTSELLLEHNMIHLVGTDAHSNRRRSPNVRNALERLREFVTEKDIEEMTTKRPQHIIDNEIFKVQEPLEVKKKKKWYQFW